MTERIRELSAGAPEPEVKKIHVPACVTLVVEVTVDVTVEAAHGTPFEAIVGEAKKLAFAALNASGHCSECESDCAQPEGVGPFRLKDVPTVKLDG